MAGRWTAAVMTIAVAALVAGCGGGDKGGTPTTALNPHPPRAVVPGHVIRITQDGPARQAGDGMPKLRTARAARVECAAAPSVYVAWTYGVISRDLDEIARVVAQRRAAPGARSVVKAGCRSGLDRHGDRP